MLAALENYYWRYTSASELVNMILAFIETRAAQVRPGHRWPVAVAALALNSRVLHNIEYTRMVVRPKGHQDPVLFQ